VALAHRIGRPYVELSGLPQVVDGAARPAAPALLIAQVRRELRLLRRFGLRVRFAQA
jgi:hypothetical protein